MMMRRRRKKRGTVPPLIRATSQSTVSSTTPQSQGWVFHQRFVFSSSRYFGKAPWITSIVFFNIVQKCGGGATVSTLCGWFDWISSPWSSPPYSPSPLSLTIIIKTLLYRRWCSVSVTRQVKGGAESHISLIARITVRRVINNKLKTNKQEILEVTIHLW